MTLHELKAAYQAGSLSKPDFIGRMYQLHKQLFDYADFLKLTGLAAIRLEPEGVVVRLAQPPIEMWCAPDDIRTAPIEALNFGSYEGPEFSLLGKIVSQLGRPAPVFLDIGANVGFYTIGLSKTISGLRAFAFEPIPRTFEFLKRNLELNGLKNVQAFNFALSNKEEVVTFYTYPSQSGASSAAKLLENTEAYEVRCPLRRLDSMAQEFPAVDVIKCDVEGAELFVFQGAEALLTRDCPVVFTEMLRKWCAKYDYHPNDIIGFFKKLGYACFVMHGEALRLCETVTPETAETNFLFLHQARHARLISELAG